MAYDNARNIVLIGMPAAGKSTSGILLAKKAGYGFVDTDILIQTRTGKMLSDILAESGIEGFLETEEEAALSITGKTMVIATGGSMVYSEKAMNYLKRGNSLAVYLKQGLERLLKRMGDPGIRGVVCPRGQSIEELYAERHPLYIKYADLIIDCGEKLPDSISEEIFMESSRIFGH